MEATVLAIWNDASENHSNLWMLYIVVVSGVLGFSFSEHYAKIVSECRPLAWVTFIALVAFMISNVVSLTHNIDVLDKSRLALLSMDDQTDKVKAAINSTSINYWVIISLHLILDALILYGLYARIRSVKK